MDTPALYLVTVSHVRTTPLKHSFVHESYMWFVDLDHLPHHGFLASFQSKDHEGDPRLSLRANLNGYLKENGIPCPARITALTNARSFGYVFNPLTLYWCHDAQGAVICTVAEVHNTYGERHRYLLFPDDKGNATADKEFYVSPFNAVEGYYQMHLPEPAEELACVLTLHREAEKPFVASVRGLRRRVTTRTLLSIALRHPFENQRIRALITLHGVRLWRRKLPVQPRPPHE